MIEVILIGIGFIAVTVIGSIISWYTVVDPSEAHLVVSGRGKFVASSDDKVASGTGKRAYFNIPRWIPWIGRSVRKLDVTIKEIVLPQETIERGQARYKVTSSTKYRITNMVTAAETFIDDAELEKQLKEVIQASVRAVTVKYDIVDARAKKLELSNAIHSEMENDLAQWGLELISFQLVGFEDTDESFIVSNISKRREVEIEAQTREENAEKKKQARIKEATAEELAKQKEIDRDRAIAEREQDKAMKVAEKKKLAQEKEYEVKRVQTIKQAEINKEQAIVLAEQKKATELIMLEQKKLEGQGDRARAEERAKGEAAPIKERGLAEAEALNKKQEALNKFGDPAIRAMVAEQVVKMQETVGVANAKALERAKIKILSGGDQEGFAAGKFFEGMNLSNPAAASSLIYRTARPQDLGFKELGLKSLGLEKASELSEEPEKKKVRRNKEGKVISEKK